MEEIAVEYYARYIAKIIRPRLIESEDRIDSTIYNLRDNAPEFFVCIDEETTECSFVAKIKSKTNVYYPLRQLIMLPYMREKLQDILGGAKINVRINEVENGIMASALPVC